MNSLLPPRLDTVRQFIARFPGIGERSAHRILVYLLSLPEEDITLFGKTVSAMPEEIRYCDKCHFFTGESGCPFCDSPSREEETICVVAHFNDVIGMESAGGYDGRYHVLGGVISPMKGIGPEKLGIKSLENRINSDTKEVILALNPETEGEVTMQYISDIIRRKNQSVKITRLAFGLPIGASLEYCDPRTISEALRNRRTV